MFELKKHNCENELYEFCHNKIHNSSLNQNYNIEEIKKEFLELKNIKIKDLIVFTRNERNAQNKKVFFVAIIILEKKMMILDFP